MPAFVLLLAFALTLFASASLLFLVQPMVGKMVLPLLGGTPAIWNTCMVFFQALLLAGYAYAHALSRRLGLRAQVLVHTGVLLLPLVPLALLRLDVAALASHYPPPAGSANPIPWLLAVLGVTAGLPFFAVATGAPLLQRWFADTTHPSARDPYFLYAASNLGSMLALLSYPTLVEPGLGLGRQAEYWGMAYAGLAALTVGCGLLAARSRAPGRAPAPAAAPSGDALAEDVPTARALRWVALAFVPSSYMLGLTTYVTTDIAPVPLLWVVPLAVYLLSFILVFSSLRPWLHWAFVLLLPAALVAVAARYELRWCLVEFFGLRLPLHVGRWWVDVPLDLRIPNEILLQLAGLFVVAMACHGELARTRPAASGLTGFYLAMSAGGVLGGLFNAVVAPFAFDKLVEYPLVGAAALLLLPRLGIPRRLVWLRRADAALSGVLGLCGVALAGLLLARSFLTVEIAEHFPEPLRDRAVRFARWEGPDDSNQLFQARNFFGSFRVVEDHRDGSTYHLLLHGTTNHGMQCMDDGRRGEPLTYFHRTGPVGQLFEAVGGRKKPLRVAVLGVGTGTLAAYMQKGWELRLFEIDPAVVKVARDPHYFTYLTDCEARGVKVSIDMGDGRLGIGKEPDGAFDLIFMDAFASDSVPVHLITREAIELYRRKLAPEGILVVNIANRYLKLTRTLGNLAAAAGLTGMSQLGAEDRDRAKYASDWVVLARDRKDFGPLPGLHDSDARWNELPTDPSLGVWTDDYSNPLAAGVFRWDD